ncbi:MAG TPA: hypothetical protein VNV44_07520 [Solirubrobacteraceae bacterium]|jgi:hypothetical protein|nr:hypothetical protein [Solirubrobacteraceae bacterium]
MIGRRLSIAALTALTLAVSSALAAPVVQAAPFADDGGAEWRLEQPEAPEAPAGIERPSWLVGLGHIGDIEFYSPNRGALITAGNGSTVPAGVWLYNGLHWRELSTACGASDGRVAWAGPDEFWTVSDGRPGQAPDSRGVLPPLRDNTLCHFAVGPAGRFEVVGSYATLAFQSTSYRAMHGAVCLAPNDCWFGGDPLEPPGEGAFQLHWDGATMTEMPYIPEGHAIEEMRAFEGSAFESLKLLATDTRVKHEATVPPLRRISAGSPPTFESLLNVPLYSFGESPLWLEALHLGSDGEALWAAGGPSGAGAEGPHEPGVTIARYSKLAWVSVLGEFVEEPNAVWGQVVGPETSPSGIEDFGEDTTVTSIAAEPGTHDAWLAIDTRRDAESPGPSTLASIARIGADGTITDRTELPEAGDPVGAKGAGEHLTCPAVHDCWLVTSQGWIFHLSNGEEPGGPPDGAFAEVAGETPIDSRPLDEGVPQTPPDTIPEDSSGEGQGSGSVGASVQELLKSIPSPFATITLPLVSGVHVKLVNRTTLVLSLHLAVKAQIRLIAKRHGKIVASTRKQVLSAGSHKLTLRLDPKRWPTKLHLEEHALAPLPTTTTRESNTTTIGTSELAPQAPLAGSWSALP